LKAHSAASSAQHLGGWMGDVSHEALQQCVCVSAAAPLAVLKSLPATLTRSQATSTAERTKCQKKIVPKRQRYNVAYWLQ